LKPKVNVTVRCGLILFLYMHAMYLKWDRAGWQQIVIQLWYGQNAEVKKIGSY